MYGRRDRSRDREVIEEPMLVEYGASPSRLRLELIRNTEEIYMHHPDEPTNSAPYFQHLTGEMLKADKLPLISLSEYRYSEGNPYASEASEGFEQIKEPVGLFPLSADNDSIKEVDFDGEFGDELSMTLLWRLEMVHLRARMRHEIKEIVKSGTTSEEQLGHIKEILISYGTYTGNTQYALDFLDLLTLSERIDSIRKLKSFIDEQQKDVMNRRYQASNIFSDKEGEHEVLRIEERRPLAIEDAREKNDEQVQVEEAEQDQNQNEIAIVEEPRRVKIASRLSSLGRVTRRERSRSDSRYNDEYDNYYSDSPHERRYEDSSEAERGETRDEREARRPLGCLKTCFGIFLVILCFVPYMVYSGITGKDPVGLRKKRDGPTRGQHSSASRAYAKKVEYQEKERVKGFPMRFLAGLVGALALIAPMLIMSLKPSQVKSLVTTSVFILAFAILVAWRTSMEPKDVMTATAVYAAVLVVFKGTNGGG